MFIINKLIDLLIGIVVLFLFLTIGGIAVTIVCALLYIGLFATGLATVYKVFVLGK
jgi:hypothetical protein